MLTNKILSVLALTLMPMANVSTVIASQDNKDDNTNMSDTLNLSSSLPPSDNSVSDANSDNNSDTEEENSAKTSIITVTVQQEPFVCDESIIESKSEEESSSEEHVFEEMINTIDSHSSSTNTENQH